MDARFPHPPRIRAISRELVEAYASTPAVSHFLYLPLRRLFLRRPPLACVIASREILARSGLGRRTHDRAESGRSESLAIDKQGLIEEMLARRW
jgi:hypothetical protein